MQGFLPPVRGGGPGRYLDLDTSGRPGPGLTLLGARSDHLVPRGGVHYKGFRLMVVRPPGVHGRKQGSWPARGRRWNTSCPQQGHGVLEINCERFMPRGLASRPFACLAGLRPRTRHPPLVFTREPQRGARRSARSAARLSLFTVRWGTPPAENPQDAGGGARRQVNPQSACERLADTFHQSCTSFLFILAGTFAQFRKSKYPYVYS